MTRKPANEVTPDLIGKKVAIYWTQEGEENRIVGTVKAVHYSDTQIANRVLYINDNVTVVADLFGHGAQYSAQEFEILN